MRSAGNSGYHGKANIPYVVAGVFSTGLTLADQPDVYAMVVSHEIAEMVVDPNVDGNNPEVCDPCDINCSGDLTRCCFSMLSDNFLGAMKARLPRGRLRVRLLTSAESSSPLAGLAAIAPASSANCQYAPILQDCQLVDRQEHLRRGRGHKNAHKQ